MVVNRLYYDSDIPRFAGKAEEGLVFSNEELEGIIRRIYAREFDTATEIDLGAWREFWRCLNEATDEGFGRRAYNADDYDFYRELRYNNAVFAAFRAHRFQNDIARQLLDEEGGLKTFGRFAYDVRTLVAPTHLRSWLRTEYSTAVIRARQAADWRRFDASRDVLPNLKWIKSTSLHPGEDHQVFWDTVRPIDDPFWNEHRPGDRWNCKCSLEATDEEATVDSRLPKGASEDRPSPGLDNNPAKDAKLFADTHPYIQNGYEGAKEAVREFIDGQTLSAGSTTFKEEIKRQRTEIREWAKRDLVGKTAYVPGLGAPVSFTSTGIKEALNQPHKHILEKNEAVRNIVRLLETAGYVRTDPDIKENRMVKAYHYYQIEIANEPSFVVIRELSTGELVFYSIVEKLKGK